MYPVSPIFTWISSNIKWISSHPLVYSFIVFKYVNLILWKEKYILGRIGLYFWGFGEKLYYFLGFGEQRKNTFREVRNFLSGILGDQCIIFRDQRNTDPLGPHCWVSFAEKRSRALILGSLVPWPGWWHLCHFDKLLLLCQPTLAVTKVLFTIVK